MFSLCLGGKKFCLPASSHPYSHAPPHGSVCVGPISRGKWIPFYHISIFNPAIQILCRLHTAILHWPLSSAATKEVQGPDTTGRRIQGLLFLACWWYMGAIGTFCPSSQNQVTGRTSVDPLPPHSDQPGLSTPSSPCWYLPHPL